jgi:putative transposase
LGDSGADVDLVQAADWNGGQLCMGRLYSLDLRRRVVAAVRGGMSCEEAAEHHEVSASTAIRWVRRERETGSPAAFAMGGSRPFALAAQRDWLLARVATKRDITLRELLAELADAASR